MNWLEWVEVTGVGAMFFTWGWLAARKKYIRERPPRPICFCKDPYGHHDPVTGVCNAQRLASTSRRGKHFIPCGCVRYTGPQPVEQYWVPPAVDMKIITTPRQLDDND